MQARILTEPGARMFRDFILKEAQPNSQGKPNLETDEYSSVFVPSLLVDGSKEFSDKYQLGEYVCDCVAKAGITKDVMMRSDALWSWLTFLWFDQLCPIKDGRRDVREMARYICSSDYTDYHRHLVAGPYYIFSSLGLDCSKLFLKTGLATHNDFMEQLASRQYMISSLSLMEVAHRLYWDNDRDMPKRGALGVKGGNLRRFIDLVGQLELTYDIYSMEPDEVLSLLPGEFDRYKV